MVITAVLKVFYFNWQTITFIVSFDFLLLNELIDKYSVEEMFKQNRQQIHVYSRVKLTAPWKSGPFRNK